MNIEKEVKVFSKQVGVFEGKVVAINPNREELSKLLGFELEKDPVYVRETDEKNSKKEVVGKIPMYNIEFWLEEINRSKEFTKYRKVVFPISKQYSYSNDGTKVNYINSVGATMYLPIDETEARKVAPLWFTHFLARGSKTETIGEKKLRKLYKGEDILCNFLLNLSGASPFDIETDVLPDMQKIFNGDLSEIKAHVLPLQTTVCALATVTFKTDGTPMQNVYNRAFLNGKYMPMFRGIVYDNARIKSILEKNGKKQPYEYFIMKIADSEYGCKDAHIIGEIRDFDASLHITGSDAVIAEDDSSY